MEDRTVHMLVPGMPDKDVEQLNGVSMCIVVHSLPLGAAGDGRVVKVGPDHHHLDVAGFACP